MKKAIDGDDERARLEKTIREPIRAQVIRPRGFAVPDDPEAIERENALMEELHNKAITEARRHKLKLLCRRYSLAEDDYRGLALNLTIEHEPRARHRKLRLLCRHYSLAENDYESLALNLAIQHEPGFRVVDRQITYVPLGFSGPVRIKEGVLSNERTGRPPNWLPERLLQLLEAVQREKKKPGGTKDLDALKQLARKKEWASPPTHWSKSTRGEHDAWVRTLQSRLHDAKEFKRKLDALKRIIEEGERWTWNNPEIRD